MKAVLCALAISAASAACVGPIEAGPYPHGFIIGGHMHYWNPKVAGVLFPDSSSHPEPYVWPQPPIHLEK